jgi:ligand-binding sensor domain-containing protein
MEFSHITAWSVGVDGALWMLKQNQLEVQGEKPQKSNMARNSADGRNISPASLVCDPKDADTAYIGLTDGRIMRTIDRGKTFTILEGGPLPVSAKSMAISPIDGSLWVGTLGNGVWILDNPKTHKAEEMK